MTKHIPIEISLHQRRRSATAAELKAIPWLQLLSAQEHLRACAALQVGDAQPGDYVCRVGRPVTYWFGLYFHHVAVLERAMNRLPGQ